MGRRIIASIINNTQICFVFSSILHYLPTFFALWSPLLCIFPFIFYIWITNHLLYMTNSYQLYISLTSREYYCVSNFVCAWIFEISLALFPLFENLIEEPIFHEWNIELLNYWKLTQRNVHTHGPKLLETIQKVCNSPLELRREVFIKL